MRIMKNILKFKKKEETAPSAQAQGKSVLLQSYFASLISLVVCVSMFLGTSFAWFTSEVNNVGNEIYIGTLDVGLDVKKPDGWKSMAADGSKLFDGSVRWEPGYTAVETIRVVNKGDLAFKYVMNFTDGALVADEAALALSDL